VLEKVYAMVKCDLPSMILYKKSNSSCDISRSFAQRNSATVFNADLFSYIVKKTAQNWEMKSANTVGTFEEGG